MRLDPGALIGDVITGSWILLLVVWVVSGFRAKRIAKKEQRAGVLWRVLAGVVGWVLLVRADDPRLGPLSLRFVPENLWIAIFAAAMTVVGVLFAIWARLHLGKYWSSTVALKSEHQLIRTGPYARIRHPIYTGILLGIAGTALAVGRYAGIVTVLIYLVAFWTKARKEEALLAGQFGPAFDEHRRYTGFFLPRLSSPQ
jgi:protein-S-isoprenylcysteine O-methyltransferase Ste14